MSAIGLAEAARLTGRNRSTIHRAMRSGKLSYSKTADGERRVEVAELQRVFGIKPNGLDKSATSGDVAEPVQSHSAHPGEVAALREMIEAARVMDASGDVAALLARDDVPKEIHLPAGLMPAPLPAGLMPAPERH